MEIVFIVQTHAVARDKAPDKRLAEYGRSTKVILEVDFKTQDSLLPHSSVLCIHFQVHRMPCNHHLIFVMQPAFCPLSPCLVTWFCDCKLQ